MDMSNITIKSIGKTNNFQPNSSNITNTSVDSAIINSNINKGQSRLQNASEEMDLSKINAQTNNEQENNVIIDGIKEISKDTATNLFHMAETAGCTLVVGASSIVEGVGEFGESIVDTLAVVGTVGATPFTWIYDRIHNLVTGESDSYTKEMWDTNMEFVSKKWVEGAFDNFYNDSILGQQLSEHALGYETVRGVGSGIGKVAGIIGITLLTGGLGTAPAVGASTSGGITSLVSAIASKAGTGAIISGISGFGEGAEKAWSEGASAIDGLKHAFAKGGIDAVSYYIGGKIGNIKIGKGISKVSKLLTSGTRVGLDTVDGAVNSLVEPLTQMTYKEGSYKSLFEENGGWQNVITSAAIGGSFSAFTEGLDASRIGPKIVNRLNNSKIINKAFNTIKNSKLINKLSSILNNASVSAKFDATSSSKTSSSFSLSDYSLRVENAKYTSTVDGFTFKSDTNEGLERLIDYYNDLKMNYSNDASVIERLNKLSESGMVITDIVKNSANENNYNKSFQLGNYVALSADALLNKNFSTFFHETGHFSDWLSGEYTLGNVYVEDAIEKLGKIDEKIITQVVKEGDFARAEIDRYLNDPSSGALEISKIIQEKMQKIIDIDKYSALEQNEIYKIIYNSVYKDRKNHYLRESGISAIEDMIDALTEGKFTETSNGRYGHGSNYYQKGKINTTTEIIAQYSNLYFSGNKDLLYAYLPESFVDSLDSIHNIIINNNIGDINIKSANNSSSKLFSPSDSRISEQSNINVVDFTKMAVGIMDKKHPGQGLARLKNFVLTGNADVITRDFNLRNMVSEIGELNLAKVLNISPNDIVNQSIKMENFDRAMSIIADPNNKMYDASKLDVLERMKKLQDLFADRDNLIKNVATNQAANDKIKTFNKTIYNKITRSSTGKIDITNIRSNIVSKFKNKTEFTYWGNVSGKTVKGDTEYYSKLGFANFKIGKQPKNIPLGNSVKIYFPSTNTATFEKDATNILQFLVDNNIASDNKIGSFARTDGLVLRIYDANDAIKVMNYINNNKEISYVNDILPASKRVGKVSVAMDGCTSMNMVASDIIGSYMQKEKNPTVSGLQNYIKKLKMDTKVNNDFSAFSTSLDQLRGLGSLDERTRKANLVQILDILEESFNVNSSNNSYMNILRNNQSPDAYNRLLSTLKN